jgi:LTXXQ motif family protein
MNKSTLAGAAMVAVAAVAVPVIGWSQSPAPPAPSAGAPQPGGAEHGGMHHGWGRWARNVSPQQACVDRIAKRAGFVASMGFKLNLTADQKPLWDKVVAATQAGEDNQRKLCAALPASADDRDKQTILDRINHHQQVLQAQLQTLQQTEPAVQALYQALTPEQKTIVDHPFRRG